MDEHVGQVRTDPLLRVLERLRYRLYPRRGDMNMGELGEHNALPAWGAIEQVDPGCYVGAHRLGWLGKDGQVLTVYWSGAYEMFRRIDHDTDFL